LAKKRFLWIIETLCKDFSFDVVEKIDLHNSLILLALNRFFNFNNTLMKKMLNLMLIICILSGCSNDKESTSIDTFNVISGDSVDQSKRRELDSIYSSAIHADTSLAVFKTQELQEKLIKAYTLFLQEFGTFLKANKFTWGRETKCWNRVYFSKSGQVDYYIYDFKTTIEVEKELRFRKLFAEYIQTHRLNITSDKKFAQCSPVVYYDK